MLGTQKWQNLALILVGGNKEKVTNTYIVTAIEKNRTGKEDKDSAGWGVI